MTNLEEKLQQDHYDKIIDQYDLHYADKYSTVYRNEILYPELFHNIEFRNKRVLEAMSGSGQSTRFLLEQGATVVGLDISAEAIKSFTSRWPQAIAICPSVLYIPLDGGSFDYVVIVGGLHHLQPNVDQALLELYRMLKPRGILCFAEPYVGSIFDWARALWYRSDRIFESNEAPLNLDLLFSSNQSRFRVKRVAFLGGPAYLLVFNSMVFRVPHRLKKLYSPLLLFIDKLFSKVLGKRSGMYTAVQLERVD